MLEAVKAAIIGVVKSATTKEVGKWFAKGAVTALGGVTVRELAALMKRKGLPKNYYQKTVEVTMNEM